MLPNIGDVFEADGHRFRVTSFTKAVKLKTDVYFKDSEGFCHQWCSRDEATHVWGRGVCGWRVKVEDCHVVGRVSWPESHIREEEEAAKRREGQFIF